MKGSLESNVIKNALKKINIIAVADLCIDILIDAKVKPEYGQVEQLADSYSLDLGGSVGIFATQMAKLGGKISVAGKLGKDPQGKIILQTLEESGVDTSLIDILDEEKTPLGLNLSCQGDRAMLTYLGTLKLIGPSIFKEEWLTMASHWHIGGYFLLDNLIPAWPEWIRTLKDNGVSISLDTNWDPAGEWKTITEILPMIDVFLPNEAEAMAISGKPDVYEAGKFLSALCPLVVIKRGAEGALAFSEDSVVEFKIPEAFLENLKILDTTGAGDNFDAGFMFEWLNNRTLNECLYRATQCGTQSLNSLGGIKAQFVPGLFSQIFR